MKDAVEKAVLVLAAKITEDVTPDEALKYTQAALNLLHVLQVKEHTARINR